MFAEQPHNQPSGRLDRPFRVDGAQENRASDEAMKNIFGWTDSTMISTYAEKHPRWAMQEASDVRRRVRTQGKSDPTSDPACV